jgi:hypothetical protein
MIGTIVDAHENYLGLWFKAELTKNDDFFNLAVRYAFMSPHPSGNLSGRRLGASSCFPVPQIANGTKPVLPKSAANRPRRIVSVALTGNVNATPTQLLIGGRVQAGNEEIRNMDPISASDPTVDALLGDAGGAINHDWAA